MMVDDIQYNVQNLTRLVALHPIGVIGELAVLFH